MTEKKAKTSIEQPMQDIIDKYGPNPTMAQCLEENLPIWDESYKMFMSYPMIKEFYMNGSQHILFRMILIGVHNSSTYKIFAALPYKNSRNIHQVAELCNSSRMGGDIPLSDCHKFGIQVQDERHNVLIHPSYMRNNYNDIYTTFEAHVLDKTYPLIAMVYSYNYDFIPYAVRAFTANAKNPIINKRLV
ncbi:MAG: hypothetical protein LBD29_03905 [Treponema sp.]|jgi:hypothetical protein|nr:hypothetical protein [Treponema sp.]